MRHLKLLTEIKKFKHLLEYICFEKLFIPTAQDNNNLIQNNKCTAYMNYSYLIGL